MVGESIGFYPAAVDKVVDTYSVSEAKVAGTSS